MLTDFPNSSVRVKHSRRARKLALRLDSKAGVMNLIIPRGVSMKRAQTFAALHQDWIDEMLAELPQCILFENGQIIPILGQDRKIVIDYDDELKRTHIEFLGTDTLLVQTNLDDPAPRIKRFLKERARIIFTDIVHDKAHIIGKTVDAISIRDPKTRWGSCSSDGKISLSWRLIFAPPEAYDYVIAHEAAHLVHMNHSKKFWALCMSLSQNYAAGKSWMKAHGRDLMRYG